MLVIADSGSTKTDWRFADEDGTILFTKQTVGFNPYFHQSDFIGNEIYQNFMEINMRLLSVTKVFFYGAGCSSPERNQVVEDGLKMVFSNAQIHVEHDLLGACRALFGDTAGIACIIGTGSNSCIWDGQKIVENIPSHGYILGDEGSGAKLGMELLKLYFKNEMPTNVADSFLKKFKPVDSDIIKKVYQGTNPNVYLASYAKFYSEHKEDVILSGIVYKALYDFFYQRILKYDNCKDYSVGFVGSIAYNFQHLLNRIAAHHGMEVDRIEPSPINALVAYHAKGKEVFTKA